MEPVLLELEGITLSFEVSRYQAHPTGDAWCKVSLSLSSGDWLKYKVENREILRSGEIDKMAGALEKLLNGSLPQPISLGFDEPDYEMELYPESDLKDDSHCLYVREGFDTTLDILMIWHVLLWDKGTLTGNEIELALVRENIEKLYQYLKNVQKESDNKC